MREKTKKSLKPGDKLVAPNGLIVKFIKWSYPLHGQFEGEVCNAGYGQAIGHISDRWVARAFNMHKRVKG